MGRRGPAPLPENVRRLRGTPSREKKGAAPALPAKPNPPSWIKGEALAEWKRVTPELYRLGRLATIDRGCLAMYCSWWEHLVQIRAELAETGYTIQGQKKNTVTNPRWREFRDASKQVLELQKQLGLTPDSRLRQASVPVSADEDDSDLDWILS